MCHGPTDGLTDGQTDGRTDGQTLLQRCVDASKNGLSFQVVGMSRDMRQRQRQRQWQRQRQRHPILGIKDVVSKQEKDFYSCVILNQAPFPVYQFNFNQSFGQSIAAGAPYVTAIKDLNMFGVW